MRQDGAANPMALARVRAAVARAGLHADDEQLAALSRVYDESLHQVEALRKWIEASYEPATTFVPIEASAKSRQDQA